MDQKDESFKIRPDATMRDNFVMLPSSLRVEIERFVNACERLFGNQTFPSLMIFPNEMFDRLAMDIMPSLRYCAPTSPEYREIKLFFSGGQEMMIVRQDPYKNRVLEAIENPYNTPASTEEIRECRKKNPPSKPDGKKENQATPRGGLKKTRRSKPLSKPRTKSSSKRSKNTGR